MRELYTTEWFPYALVMGITWSEFWEMTPAIIEAHKKGFRLKKEEDNAYAYIQGIYVRDALASTVGNMFRKKGSKAIEYPSEPYGMYKDEQIEEVQDGEEIMTEDEKRRKTEALFMQLRLMQANFELSKQAKKYEGEQ